jgi:uncharacterized protein with FMN-binding domain
MKKVLTSAAFLLIFALYAISRRPQVDVAAVPAFVPTRTSTQQTTAAATEPVSFSPSSSAPPSAAVTSPPVATTSPPVTPVRLRGLYADGSYTSSAYDAYYGNIQVRVTVQGGRVADVAFLDHPQDRGRSIEINNYAMPQLRYEAIQAQRAPVDIVSGATDTSEAFNASLGDALSQAKAA